ncbi:MAG: NAD-binding protein [Bacteroidota bacterium]
MRRYWNRDKLKFYSIPSSFMSVRIALVLLVWQLAIGLLGFMLIEGYDLVEAFYMVVITLSTVGYTEVAPLSTAGRLFASFYIVMNVGFLSYILAVFSYYVVQGEIFKKMHVSLINNRIDKLDNHVILCGFGRYGQEITEHFIDHDLSFVIIDADPNKIEQIQTSPHNLLYILGDATQDEVLLRAGIKRAKAIITALPDDSDNVFIVLTAKQLQPTTNIISRAKYAKSQRKLLLAGANHVVMPEQIGGFYMATLVSKPGSVEFFSFITNEFSSDIGFEELSYDTIPEPCRGKSIRDLRIRGATGANIIGYRAPDGEYVVNPAPDTILLPRSSFIVLGDDRQLKLLKGYIKEYKG